MEKFHQKNISEMNSWPIERNIWISDDPFVNGYFNPFVHEPCTEHTKEHWTLNTEPIHSFNLVYGLQRMVGKVLTVDLPKRITVYYIIDGNLCTCLLQKLIMNFFFLFSFVGFGYIDAISQKKTKECGKCVKWYVNRYQNDNNNLIICIITINGHKKCWIIIFFVNEPDSFMVLY